LESPGRYGRDRRRRCRYERLATATLGLALPDRTRGLGWCVQLDGHRRPGSQHHSPANASTSPCPRPRKFVYNPPPPLLNGQRPDEQLTPWPCVCSYPGDIQCSPAHLDRRPRQPASTDFWIFPQAVAAASPGDTLQVRSSPAQNYTAPVIDRSLLILGDALQSPTVLGSIEVRSIQLVPTLLLRDIEERHIRVSGPGVVRGIYCTPTRVTSSSRT